MNPGDMRIGEKADWPDGKETLTLLMIYVIGLISVWQKIVVNNLQPDLQKCRSGCFLFTNRPYS